MPPFTSLDPADYALPPTLTRETLSPALVIWLDRVRANIETMTRAMDGRIDRWQPHVKTLKIPEVFAELVRAGVRHFKCATTREAEHLCKVIDREGVEGAEVLVAYPLIGPALARLGQIADAHPTTRLCVLCEDEALVDAIPGDVSIYIDLNPGMNRTGLPVEDGDAIRAVARAAGERFRGLHYYDGQYHDEPPEERTALVHTGYDQLLELRAALVREGFKVDDVVTAGTPAFLSALAYGPFRELDGTRHRISPGTVTYHDALSEKANPDFELAPAALVFSRVVSHPTRDVVTCDAGSKSIAAEVGDPVALVLGRPELVALRPNEEHLPLRVTSGERPPRGTELLLFPRHVCPTINLAEEAILMDGDEVRDVVPVAARAHELRLESE